MPNFLKKILSLVFFFCLFWSFSSPIQASYLDLQGQNPSETFKQALESDGMNYTQFSLNSLDQISMGLTKKMVGYPFLKGEVADNSLFNTTSKAIAYLYTNQPSFVNYLAYESQKLNLIKPVYAATGNGWNWLGDPVLNIWTIFRNVTYLFFVIIFVSIGFMIMFRSKLNPQTVINIQLALPRVIVSLIMVTFSYAISGLIIDVVFLGHGLIRNIIVTEDLGTQCPPGSGLYKGLVFNDPNTVWEQDCANNINTPSAWPFHIMNKYGNDNIVATLFAGVAAAIGGALKGGFGELFKLIISFSVIGATFKIFFSLLTKYVMIVILVITMPFSFLGSALSAQSSPIKPLKALLANTISFPVTSFLLVLAFYFSSSKNGTSNLPPFYISDWAGTGAATSTATSLIAIGILMAIPTILASIDKMFEAQPIAQAATEQLAGGFRKIPLIGGLMG